MIYYQDGETVIRNMEESDAEIFTEEYSAQGWHPDIAVYRKRIQDQAEGKCVALTAEYRGRPAGFVNVYLDAQEGPFKGKGFPIIVDFSVLQKYQRKGIGTRLMDAAEQIAGQYADTVCLGVGLHDGYGSAQRMYAKRGYIPDGSGVWYQDKPCVQYETVCTVDDDLILFMSKELENRYLCRTASPAEMNRKWDYEIRQHPGEENWKAWKEEAISNALAGRSIPYYGFLDGMIICEATAVPDPDLPPAGREKMPDHTVELSAFRTVKAYRGKGYFSRLMDFMLEDLKRKGYRKAVVGVEPEEKRNREIYRHWGFTEEICSGTETYPDGTVIDVLFFGKTL